MKNLFYEIFQEFLWKSRLMILLAVISGIISTTIIIIIGTYEVYQAIFILFNILHDKNMFEQGHHIIVQHVINSIDMYLISTVLLIFSIGLYELFIKKFDNTNIKNNMHSVLIIKSLEQLKSKIAQTIIMILIVCFFQKATQMNYKNTFDLLYLGLGILFISISIHITHKK